MATFLDISGLEYFSKFFVFLFVWLVVYALLQYTKVMGEGADKTSQGISIILGLIIGLFVLFSPIATGIIEYIAPWFAVIFVFIVLATVVLKMVGASSSDLGGTQIKTLIGVIIVIVLIVGSLQYVRDNVSVPGDNETSVDYSKTSAVLFHPSILGAIFILVIAIFTVALLAKK